MAVAKQFLKSKPIAKVTFELSAEAVNGAKTVALAGEFNGWESCPVPEKAERWFVQNDG